MKRFFLLFFLLFLCSSIVSAELTSKEIADINNKYSSGNDTGFFERYYLALQVSDFNLFSDNFSWKGFGNGAFSFSGFFLTDFLGFGDYQNFKEGHLGIIFGVLVGLLLWLFCKIRKLSLVIDGIRTRRKYKDYDPEYNLKERESGDWIYLIAGRIWKVFPIAVFIWLLTNLPFINRIVEIASLQFFNLSLFAHAFIFALEVGMLPQLIKDYADFRTKIKLEKKLLNMQMGAKKQEAVGETTRR